ncbi:MAG: cellulase family glycosylhydrolase [Anaerolineae bacterium]
MVITPTPDPNAATHTPTLQPPTATVTETETSTASATATMESPTAITEEADISATPDDRPPTATLIGPILAPDYTLPEVPPPRTPSVLPTIAGIPTITHTPLPPTRQPQQAETEGPSPTPVTGFDAARMGIQVDSNLDFDSWMGVVGDVETTGVHWIKVQVNWGFLQPDRPNEFNDRMQLFERQIEAMSRPPDHRVLLSIAKAPLWARTTDQTEDGPPDNPQALADFITFMLRDTKIGESVDAIEVWNEPNLIREWRGPLPHSGAGYMQLFRPAYDAIRAYSPDMDIVTAGLAPTSNLPGAIDDREFLQQMYDAGLSSYQDIHIGAHPYGWGNPPDARCCDPFPNQGWDEDPHFFFISNIEETYDIMQRNGHGDLQMWITEFGWSSWNDLPSSAPEPWHTYTSAVQQGNYMLRAFEIGQDLPYVGVMFLWNLNFANESTVGNSNEISGFSIINPVLFPRERPAFWMLAQATGSIPPQ